jgi:hypothetical protein
MFAYVQDTGFIDLQQTASLYFAFFLFFLIVSKIKADLLSFLAYIMPSFNLFAKDV